MYAATNAKGLDKGDMTPICKRFLHAMAQLTL